MKIREQLILGLLIILVAGMACKKDSSSSDEDEGGNLVFPTEVQAVWQDEQFNDGDEIGLYFTEDEVWSWDYFGDSFDQGDDCYFNFKAGDLIERDGDVYTVRFNSFGGTEDVPSRFNVQGDTLTITDIDANQDLKYSNTNMSVGELGPECTNKLSKSQLKIDRFSKILDR